VAAAPRNAPFDDVRLALLDAVFAAKAAGRLDQDAWEEAFGSAARSLRLRVLADAEQMIRAAAAHSRYPARRLQAILPDAGEAEALLNKMLAAGMPLEQLGGLGDDPVSRRARGAALETAWEAAVNVAVAESARWRATAARVAEWRRPLLPLWIAGGVILLVALVVAGWLSGELAAPAWFRSINEAWWRLWP
jgi:hypothetical protein